VSFALKSCIICQNSKFAMLISECLWMPASGYATTICII